ncbi:MAG: flagellar biosynthesis protein FlhF [Treponema sp.]|jgi:flagellar biosynthesis protein FlhF|nr:flagellar biosynthesis protein FlhF [Treponema sp.]
MLQFFTERAENYEEAYRKVREKYGENATIMNQSTVIIPGPFFGFPRREGVEVSGPIPQYRKSGYDPRPPLEVRSLIETRPKDARRPEARTTLEAAPPKEPLDFDKEKQKVLAAAGSRDPTLQMVLSEIKTVKEKIEEQNLALNQDEHPSISRMAELLNLNDFPSSYKTSILSRIRKEFSLDELENFQAVQDKVLEWIGESISIYKDSSFHRRPRIIVLVGPTGVGKTTTIAKLAANFGIDDRAKRIKEIALITIDTFRIGARQQLEAYGTILKYPCIAVEDFNELKKTLALHSEADMILIDTIGKSPRDSMKLGEMKQLLDACGSQAEVHLALSAATKSCDILEILQQFEPFNYRSVIVTKLDETTRVGNIIGALAEKKKSISYITNGQKVPADICTASVVNFLINLDGFTKVNRIKLEGLFPETGSGQFRQWS